MRNWLKAIIAPVALAIGTLSFAAEPQVGKDYVVIESPSSIQQSSKVTVTEFFSYQCPHCFAFAKPLHDWSVKLPPDVVFERRAVSVGHQSWVDSARTFYALRNLGNLETLDADLFNAIHQQRIRLDKLDLIMGWLNQRKVPLLEFDKAYRSAEARSAYELGEQLTTQYKVPSVPAMVIDGKYLVAIASDASYLPQLSVVDYLIARARAERAN
jgi:thiol:disulfide interchange protein DsbA